MGSVPFRCTRPFFGVRSGVRQQLVLPHDVAAQRADAGPSVVKLLVGQEIPLSHPLHEQTTFLARHKHLPAQLKVDQVVHGEVHREAGAL